MGCLIETHLGLIAILIVISSIAMVRLLAADSDVVLRVAQGIVRVAGGIVRAEVRLSGGIDRLIGVAAGKGERHKARRIGIRISRTSSSTTDGAVGLRDRRLASAAASGVVLRVADGIVRIGVLVMAGEDLGGRLRRGIDRLIGVAAGKRERRDRENDGKPHGRFQRGETGRRTSAWSTRRRARPSVSLMFAQAIGQPIGDRLLAPSPLAALAARKGPSVATAQTEPRSRLPPRVRHAVETRTLQRKLPCGLKRPIRRIRLNRGANPKNANNFFHQTEIRPILLPVAEPETDRVRMLREQGRIFSLAM